MPVTVEQPRMVETSSRRSVLTLSSALVTVLVLAQAILAGRGLYIDHDLIEVHSVVADVVALAAIAQVALAFLAFRRGQATGRLIGLSLSILVLIFVQIGLGHGVEESSTAASLHVPNGVLIFGLSGAMTVLTWGRARVR